MKRALLLVLLLTTPAFADSIPYTIMFTPTNNSGAPQSPGFLYDPSVPSMTPIVISYGGRTFTLLPQIPSIQGASACLGGRTGVAASYAMLSGECGPASYFVGQATLDISVFEIGSGSVSLATFPLGSFLPTSIGTVTIAQVPEPATWMLLSLPAIFLLTMKHRIRNRMCPNMPQKPSGVQPCRGESRENQGI
jgi:hypothetical protein